MQQDVLRMYENVVRCHMMVVDIARCLLMHQDVPGCSKILSDAT